MGAGGVFERLTVACLAFEWLRGAQPRGYLGPRNSHTRMDRPKRTTSCDEL